MKTSFGMKGSFKEPGTLSVKKVPTATLMTRKALGAEAMKALSTPKLRKPGMVSNNG